VPAPGIANALALAAGGVAVAARSSSSRPVTRKGDSLFELNVTLVLWHTPADRSGRIVPHASDGGKQARFLEHIAQDVAGAAGTKRRPSCQNLIVELHPCLRRPVSRPAMQRSRVVFCRKAGGTEDRSEFRSRPISRLYVEFKTRGRRIYRNIELARPHTTAQFAEREPRWVA